MVSIVFRARRRIRSRRLAHPRGLARRFLAGQRPEGVDDRRALFGLRSIAGTHRRQCAQAHRPDDVLDRHEDAGCGGTADSPDVRWSDFNEVYLTDARVPDSQRLGDVGAGWKVALVTLMNERG